VTLALADYADDFGEEPGYLDFGFVGPVGRAVASEESVLRGVLEHARFGALAPLHEQEARARRAAGRMLGLPAEQVAFQPNTSTALMHAMFGLTGGVALSPGEFPAVTFAAQRAADALHAVRPHWVETDHGRLTPGELRDQLESSVEAVAVSLVDFRTGYLADLEGIRQVIGDRVLVVDATQGLGVVDAAWGAADVIAAGGQKWPRAGWGTGFLALSERAIDRLVPVWSGFVATDADGMPMDELPPPTRGARAFTVSHGDPIAAARLATALERMTETGVPAIAGRVREIGSRVIELLDSAGVPVASPRADAERAGLVVAAPPADALTPFVAALHNAGVSATSRAGRVRFGVHVSTTDETLGMLRAALTEFGTLRSV
jgi:selenocysteine lyase/cysteine desulfurase